MIHAHAEAERNTNSAAGANRMMKEVIAVSYTHLDVYKRQSWGITKSFTRERMR